MMGLVQKAQVELRCGFFFFSVGFFSREASSVGERIENERI